MKRGIVFVGFVAGLALVLAIPAALFSPIRDVYFTVSRPVLAAASGFGHTAAAFFNFGGVLEENRLLRSKLDNFRRLSFEHKELELENTRLRTLLDFRGRLATSLKKAIPCQVIGRSPAGWRESIIIDRGREDGIQLDMPVTTYSGLLGRVSEMTPHTAMVKLVTHPRFRIGALIQRTRHTGVVYGTAEGECRIKYLSMDADVQLGDVVETAGFSETLPKGLLIGTIDAVWKEPGQLYRVASIRLAADVDRLEEVLCVVP